jgi:hypothetical protein
MMMNSLQKMTELLVLSDWSELPMSHDKRVEIYQLANEMRADYLVEKQDHDETRYKLIEAKKELSSLKRNAK